MLVQYLHTLCTNTAALTAAEWCEDVDVLKAGLQFLDSKGISSIHTKDGNRHLLELLRIVKDKGDPIARVSVPFHNTHKMPLSGLDRASGMAANFTGEKLTRNRVKIFINGVIESGTAAMLADDADRPSHCGDPIFEAARLAEAAIEIDLREMQITVHAIGDAGARSALDAYQAARDAIVPASTTRACRAPRAEGLHLQGRLCQVQGTVHRHDPSMLADLGIALTLCDRRITHEA